MSWPWRPWVQSHVRALELRGSGLLRWWVLSEVEQLHQVLPITLKVHHVESKFHSMVLKYHINVVNCEVMKNIWKFKGRCFANTDVQVRQKVCIYIISWSQGADTSPGIATPLRDSSFSDPQMIFAADCSVRLTFPAKTWVFPVSRSIHPNVCNNFTKKIGPIYFTEMHSNSMGWWWSKSD